MRTNSPSVFVSENLSAAWAFGTTPHPRGLVASLIAVTAALAGTTGVSYASGTLLPERSAWLSASVIAPVEARAPIYITLTPAEAPCRKAHGDNWWLNCSISAGRAGAVVQGVQLSPAIAGTWRWRDESTLAFEPKEAWQPGRFFTVSLAGIPLPLRAGIENTVLTIETPPLTAIQSTGTVWIDPKLEGDRWVSFEFHFSTAPERKKIESAFRIETKKGSSVRLAKPAFLWSDEGTNLYVKTKILALPVSREVISARIAGVADHVSQQNGRFTIPKGFETVRVQQTLPGTTDLFAVEEASLQPVRDEALNVEYELTLRTTLETDPRETLKNLRLVTLPARMNEESVSEADWTRAPVIDEEILSRAQPIEATIAPEYLGRSNRTKLRFSAPEGSFLYLELPEGFGPNGITPESGSSKKTSTVPGLSETWSTVLPVPRLTSSLEFLQPGNMLTLSGNRSLALVSTGVERIRWRIARVRDDFLALAAEEWNSLQTPSPDTWTSAQTGEITLAEGVTNSSGRARFTTLDLTDALKENADAGPGLFQIELQGVRSVTQNGKTSDEVVAHTVRRVLLTNIALIAKTSADDSIDIFAANFQDGRPATKCHASILAANGTVIQTLETDENGHAHFATTKGLERERRPVAIVVRNDDATGKDLAWLSLTDASNIAPTYRWDVGGRELRAGNITALAFADRGVLRAGETAHFGITARGLDGATLPEGMPLTGRISDEAGTMLFSTPLALSAEGLASLDWTVPLGLPPGRMRLDLLSPDGRTILATTDVLVAEASPETLALSATLPFPSAEKGWATPANVTVPARLTSLFGAGAENRPIEGELVVTPSSNIHFAAWPGFTFSSETPNARSRRLPLERVKTSGTGEADLALTLSALSTSLTGFAEASLTLTGLETDGGEAVEKRFNFLLNPSDMALGWRLSDTPQPTWFLPTGRPATLEIAAVDTHLAAKIGVPLKARIERTHTVTALVEDGSGRLMTDETPVAETVRTVSLLTDANGLAHVALDTTLPGDWRVVVTGDDSELPLLTVPYSTVGGTLAQLHEFATSGELITPELRGKLEKTTLNAGDTARVSLLSPLSGFGLITIESAGVIASHWAAIREGENLLEIPVPQDFTGRAWVRVALVRGAESATGFFQGFAEWAAPVLLNTESKRLALHLSVPKETRPGTVESSSIEAAPTAPQTIQVPVTLRAEEPARVFLWAVDEGLLALTNYKTPDPVAALLEDRALEVTTRETLSKLMPDAGTVAALTSPFGGDGVENAKLASAFGAASPFSRNLGAAALWWGGLVDVGPEEKTFTAEIPAGFNGKLKFFAVGASPMKTGATATTGIVREPLVVSTTLPAAVSPGDRFRAGFTITPEEALHITAGAIDIRPPAGFLPESATIPVIFPATGGAIVSSDFTVPENAAQLGESSLNVLAVAGDIKTRRNASFVIRPAAVKESLLSGGRLKDTASDDSTPTDKTKTTTSAPRALRAAIELTPFQSFTRFTVSTTPTGLLATLGEPFALKDSSGSAKTHVNNNPQTPAEAIAAALPLTLVATQKDGALPAEVINQLRTRQASAIQTIESALGRNGVQALPGLEPDLYLTAWSLEYLLVAKASPLGAEVPPELLRNLRNILIRTLPNDPTSLDEARSTAYALWVLTREGTMTTEWLEALRASLADRFPDWQRDTTAIFMAAAYQQMRLREEATELLTESISAARAGGAWSPERATALASAALSHVGLDNTPTAKFLSTMMIEDFAYTLQKSATIPLSALHAGAIALAIGELPRPPVSNSAADSEEESAPLEKALLVCTRRAPGFTGGEDQLERTADALRLTAPGCTEVTIKGDTGAPLWWEVEQSGWPHTTTKTTKAVRQGLDIERTFLDASGHPAKHFRTGERVTVRIRLHSSSGDVPLRDVAITDLLPGGFTYAMPLGTGPEGARQFLRGETQMSWLSPELTSWGPTEFTYVVRATTPGDYAVAPIAASSLTHPAIHARSASSRITILDEVAWKNAQAAKSEATPSETPPTAVKTSTSADTTQTKDK